MQCLLTATFWMPCIYMVIRCRLFDMYFKSTPLIARHCGAIYDLCNIWYITYFNHLAYNIAYVVMLHSHMSNVALTHWGRVTYLCVNKLTIIGSDNGFVAWPVPSHYISQRWNIVHWTLSNKLHWKVNRNSLVFIQEHMRMSSGKCWPFCLGPNVLI